MTTTTAGQATSPVGCLQLVLVEEFGLLGRGRRLTIPHIAERVLTYLALADRPVVRSRVAGSLWPNYTSYKALKNLRTALWRLRQIDGNLVQTDGERVCLNQAVVVDFYSLTALAQQLVRAPDSQSLSQVHLLLDHVALLPDWDEEWIDAHREQYRLVRLAGLESAACALLDQGRPGTALMVARAVVQTEPLLESARRIVMRVHLSEGNVVEAIREHRHYRQLLRSEFGVEPSTAMQELLSACYRTP